MDCTDDQLVLRCMEDDLEAGQELFARYALFVYRLAYRVTANRSHAEEVAQETWLRIFKNLHGYRQGTSFRAWCGSICYRLCIDLLRREKTVREADRQTVASRFYADALSPREKAAGQELLQKIREKSKLLPDAFRHAFALRYFGELSYREIADIQGCSEVTARTKVFRATQALRDLFGNDPLVMGGVL